MTDTCACRQSTGAEGEITEPVDIDHGNYEAAYVDLDGNRVRIGSPLPAP